MPFQLRRQPNGSYAVYHARLRETMHPHLGPWEEATRLYAGGSGLERALTGRKQPGDRAEIVVFDVGLGGAANALAAIACREGLVRSGRQVRPLAIVSFEQDLEALAFVVDHADELGYPRGYLDALRAILARGEWDAPGIRWELRLGDFARLIQSEPRRADIVFFDPFSHRTNPVMWSVPVLEGVYRCRRPGSGQRLVTYSSAFSVRAALLLAGYYVGDGVRLDGRPTTIAVTSSADLEEPLDLGWLARWRRDREPWPPETPQERHKAVREALLAHPQWSRFELEAEAAQRGMSAHRETAGRPGAAANRGADTHRGAGTNREADSQREAPAHRTSPPGRHPGGPRPASTATPGKAPARPQAPRPPQAIRRPRKERAKHRERGRD